MDSCLTQTETIRNVTYKVNTFFNCDSNETVTDKLKKYIEKQIAKAPLKSEK